MASLPCKRETLFAIIDYSVFNEHRAVEAGGFEPPQQRGGRFTVGWLWPLTHASYFSGADDRSRTGDLHVGNVALYQLSYVRIYSISHLDLDHEPHGAVSRDRTGDLRFTKPLLYRLSYHGAGQEGFEPSAVGFGVRRSTVGATGLRCCPDIDLRKTKRPGRVSSARPRVEPLFRFFYGPGTPQRVGLCAGAWLPMRSCFRHTKRE